MVVMYFTSIVVMGYLITSPSKPSVIDETHMFVSTNGLHAYLIFPVKNENQDWQKLFPTHQFLSAENDFRYIAFGWGDRAFYLNTPSWDQLSVAVLLRALFKPTPSLIQVKYLKRSPQLDASCVKVSLSLTQYQSICDFIELSFQKDTLGNPILIVQPGYTAYDRFYEAKGRYTLLNTCNNWVNHALKLVGIKTAMWSPLDKPIFYHLRNKTH